MRLVRDVLDNQLVDCHQRKCGKADGIILEVREGSPPRVLGLEIGPSTKARRISPALGRLVARWAAPYFVPWSKICDVGIDIDLDIDANKTPLMSLERRLAALVRRIPFA